eukprot:s2437_g9.t1
MAAELVSSPLRHCPLCVAASSLQPHGDATYLWGLSYAMGFCRLQVRRLRCPSCRAWFLGCWAFPHGGQSRVVIACNPDTCTWFFFRERLHADSFVALHADYLRFMTAAFLFLRASFSGLVKTAQAMFPGPVLTHHDCQRCVEHGWFLYNTLHHTWEEARVGTVFDLRLDALDQTLAQHERLLHGLLHRSASSHTCAQCANPVLAGDGGMKLTTSLCNERTSAAFTDPHLGLRVTLGCTNRPQAKSVFCRHHQLPPHPQLPPEIRDHKRIDGAIHFRYVGSSDFLPVQQIAVARLRQYDSQLALLDYAAADPDRFAAAARPGLPAEAPFLSAGFWDLLQMDATDDEFIQTCNCMKDERKRLAVRRYAGVFVIVLPCGHIVHVHHLVGSESLPQVALCFAQALSLTRAKRFLCYDNACALARFCRNPVRAHRMRIFRDCRFVLPESHARGHTACLDPTHVHFLPEVRKSAHPELQGINTEAQEHVFAWVRWLVYVANPMAPVRHRVFFLLLCIARNQHRGIARTLPRRRRERRWGLWRGAARAADGAPGNVAAAAPPHVEALGNEDPVAAVPADDPMSPAPVPPFLLNLRDRKLHRMASHCHVACGATLPKRWRYLHARAEEPRAKLCLRNGCFSPGAALYIDSMPSPTRWQYLPSPHWGPALHSIRAPIRRRLGSEVILPFHECADSPAAPPKCVAAAF